MGRAWSAFTSDVHSPSPSADTGSFFSLERGGHINVAGARGHSLVYLRRVHALFVSRGFEVELYFKGQEG